MSDCDTPFKARKETAMNTPRKLIFVGSAAAIALICSASDVSVVQAEGAVRQAALDDLALRVTNSVAQWQPASGYVPVEYPTDGSWERTLALAGH